MSAMTARGASRAPARRAHPAGQLPLFLDVLGLQYTLREVPRDAGDEARLIVALALPDGTTYHAADCRDWHECDCPVYLDGQDAGQCHHLRALARESVFEGPSGRWAPWMEGKREGGRR